MRPSASIVRAARSAAASQRAAAIAPIAPRALFAGLPSATNSAASSSTIRPFSSTVPVLKKASKAEKKGGKDSKASKKGQQEEEVEEALTEAEVKAIVDKARKKMEKSADWAKAAIYDGVERGRGRVMPGECGSGRRATASMRPGTEVLLYLSTFCAPPTDPLLQLSSTTSRS